MENTNSKNKDKFVLRLSEKFPHIKMVGEYLNAHTKIEFYCEKHKHYFWSMPSNILRVVYGCPICAEEGINSYYDDKKEEFYRKFNKENNSVVLLEDYKGMREKILVMCKECGRQYYAFPEVLIKGGGCSVCSLKKVQQSRVKTNEVFLSQIATRNPNYDKFKVLTPYVRDDEYVTCECLECNRTWLVTPHHLTLKKGATSCPYCCLSKGEGMIRRYLEEHEIEFEAQKTFDDLVGLNGGLLRYDFYIPKNNLLIEYQGQFHDGSVSFQTPMKLKYRLDHDEKKREYANKNSIGLLEIWYQSQDKIPEILEKQLCV